MKAFSPVALAPVGKATAITVILGLIAITFPMATVVVMPFLVLPAAHAGARWGVLNSVIVAVISGVLLSVGVGPGGGLLVCLLVLGMGTVLGEAVRKNLSFGKSLVSLAGAALMAAIVWGILLWQILGLGLIELRKSAYESIEGAATLYAQMGVNSSTAASVSSQLRTMVDIAPRLVPGLLGMGSVLLAACCLGLAATLFPRLRQKVLVGQSLSGFRMHWGVAYSSIAGLAMLLFARGAGDWRSLVMYVGINVLLVSQTLFFIQGMAVVRWFTIVRQLGLGARTGLYAAAVVGQAFLQLTGLMGLLDTWVDYRKRFALKSPGAGSAR